MYTDHKSTAQREEAPLSRRKLFHLNYAACSGEGLTCICTRFTQTDQCMTSASSTAALHLRSIHVCESPCVRDMLTSLLNKNSRQTYLMNRFVRTGVLWGQSLACTTLFIPRRQSTKAMASSATASSLDAIVQNKDLLRYTTLIGGDWDHATQNTYQVRPSRSERQLQG